MDSDKARRTQEIMALAQQKEFGEKKGVVTVDALLQQFPELAGYRQQLENISDAQRLNTDAEMMALAQELATAAQAQRERDNQLDRVKKLLDAQKSKAQGRDSSNPFDGNQS